MGYDAFGERGQIVSQPLTTRMSLFDRAWVVVLAMAALLMAALNFLLGLGLTFSGANRGMALLAGALCALAPFALAAILGRLGPSRSWHSFFKSAAYASLLPIFCAFLSLGTSPPELQGLWPESAEQPLDVIELRPEYVGMPKDTVELPPDVVERPPE